MHGPRVNPVVSGVATIIVVIVVFAAVIVSGIPGGPQLPVIGSHDMLVKVQVPDADNLAPHASVEIAGVKIGEVRNVDGEGSQAVATLDIFPGNTDIHRDATVQLRPHGLFGPKFVQINPGTGNAAVLQDGETIPGSSAALPVDLDQVLHELQAPERTSLQTIFVELGKAAEGRGDDVNHLFAAAKSITQMLDTPVQSLDAVAPNLSDMLVQNEAFNASFAQVPLDQLVANSNATLAVLASNSDHLMSIIDHANNTLASLNASLSGEVGNLRSTIEKLPAFIDAFNRFNDLTALFGANFTGKEPGFTDITQGIIGAIENPLSAFSSSTSCTPNVNGCPADGKAHYVRVQTFNVVPNLPTPPAQLCSALPGPITIPGVGPVNPGGLLGCPATAAATHASATAIPGAASTDAYSSLDIGSLTGFIGS